MCPSTGLTPIHTGLASASVDAFNNPVVTGPDAGRSSQ